MKYSKIILDTNLFLLFIVGKIDINLIPKVNKLSAYSIEDYYNVLNLIRKADELIVTNSIITETCNHLDKINRKYNNEIFKQSVSIINSMSDRTIKLHQNIVGDTFIIFGFADSEIYNISDNSILILTDDLRFYDYMKNNGRYVFNINHIRQGLWFN